jgi:hypothetical protein
VGFGCGGTGIVGAGGVESVGLARTPEPLMISTYFSLLRRISFNPRSSIEVISFRYLPMG